MEGQNEHHRFVAGCVGNTGLPIAIDFLEEVGPM